MRNTEGLLIATVSAVVAFGAVFVTGRGLDDGWTIPLVALVVFVVLASVVEYVRGRTA